MTGFNFSQGGGNTDLSATTATAADVKKGAVFFDNTGNKTIGSMPEEAGRTITPSTGELTAITQGKLAAGDIKVAAVPTQSKTVTPTNSKQTILPDTGKFLSKVVVNAADGTNFACGTVASARDLQINIPKPGGMNLSSTITNFGLVLADGTMQHTAANADSYVIALWADGDNIAADKGHFVFSWYANSTVKTNSYVDGLLIRTGSPNFSVIIDSTEEFYFDTGRSYFYFVTWE